MNSTQQKKGAIFDLDGTLLDSMGVWSRVDIEFLEKRGIALPADYAAAVKAMSFSEAARYTIRRFGLAQTENEIIEEWREMVQEEYACRIPLKPGAGVYLSRLHRDGVRIGLATACGRELYEPALVNNGIFGLFDAFASVSEAGRGKGFPDIYLLAAKRLGVNPGDCTVFEDIPEAVRGAKAAGMRTVGVFDAASAGDRVEMERLADAFIENFTDLL